MRRRSHFPPGELPAAVVLRLSPWRVAQLHRIDLVLAIYGALALLAKQRLLAKVRPALTEAPRKRKYSLVTLQQPFAKVMKRLLHLRGTRLVGEATATRQGTSGSHRGTQKTKVLVSNIAATVRESYEAPPPFTISPRCTGWLILAPMGVRGRSHKRLLGGQRILRRIAPASFTPRRPSRGTPVTPQKEHPAP